MTDNEMTEAVFGCTIEMHKSLGPGLLGSACEECLDYGLRKIVFWKIERFIGQNGLKRVVNNY